jgi:hypothetical protein
MIGSGLFSARLVGESAGERQRELADNSGLLGFIWQLSSSDIFIDVGVEGDQPPGCHWQLITGLT